MLNMLYSLQECFTQVRSFVFVAGLDEVTNIFEDHEINQAIEKDSQRSKYRIQCGDRLWSDVSTI